jgi:hypothetical protein|tara:strand:- start:2157 stop:2357 length:201 start_codon:yes stop_codon:yes gene_type:complete
MSDVVTTGRMTVTKLGKRVEELSEVMDIIHNDVGELKELLKTLIELQIVKTPEIAVDEAWVSRMYG